MSAVHNVNLLTREKLVMLFLKGINTLAGSSGLHSINWAISQFEIDYWCRKRFQEQGYITESTEAITNFALRPLGRSG